MARGIGTVLTRIVDVKPDEVAALLWSFAYFFFLLCTYYVLRPLRDNAGITGGVGNLPWLFTATFLVMLAAVPAYGWLVARLKRRTFILTVYHFFTANILLFYVLLSLDIERQSVARVFFVWLSVFNVFAVSVFWSYLADLFRSDQGKRLYGFIAAGGSIGALAGPALTGFAVSSLGPVTLFLVAALLLQGAAFAAIRLERTALGFGTAGGRGTMTAPPVGGASLEGFILLFRSPYLGGIALWVILLSLAGTVLYLVQADIVREASDNEADRVRIFATIDFAAAFLSIALQFLVTGKFITRLGVGTAAAFLPVVFAIGYAAFAFAPALFTVMAFQTLQRTSNFVISNPAREILFTVADRDEKYKAKNIIDGLVFRGADAGWAWAFTQVHVVLGLGIAAIASMMVPVAALWGVLAIALGRAQERRVKSFNSPSGEKSDVQ
jgi:AAA family ATP:ADP antiporter